MKIYLKKINADSRKINKWSYAPGDTGAEKTVYLTDDTNILYPVITLDYDAGIFTSGYNYLYIPDFKRYYYITGLSCDDGKKIIITCSIDVLNTYKEGIMNAPCNVIRSESAGIGFYPDAKLPIEPDRLHPYMKQLDPPFTKTDSGYRIVVGIFNAR